MQTYPKNKTGTVPFPTASSLNEDSVSAISYFTEFALRYPKAKSVELYKEIRRETALVQSSARAALRDIYQIIPNQKRILQTEDSFRLAIKKIAAIAKVYRARFITGIVIADVMLLLVLAVSMFSPLSLSQKELLNGYLVPVSLASAGDSAQPRILTGDAGKLIALFQERGLSVSVGGQTRKTGLSAVGNVVTADRDTFLVFAYPNASSARAEALSLAARYAKGTSASNWSDQVHIYAKDSLVIFYLGTKTTLTDTFAKFAGDSL